MITQFHTIAFTHRNLDVSFIGQLHMEPSTQEARFSVLKTALNIDEILFLSTCNRVEFLVVSKTMDCTTDLAPFFAALYPEMKSDKIAFFVQKASVLSGIEAVDHVLRVASSIDSLVIGEREIITQVRQAYNSSKEMGLSGDFLRLLTKHTIETAKRVYTETKISLKPVSVVSIAYQRLQGMNVKPNARVLVIGSGVTNTAMCRFLKKHGMDNFVVFNRTLENAQKLADELGGTAYPLSDLETYSGGFDVLVTCTGSESQIITKEIYAHLLQGDPCPKMTIDLALPNDISNEVHEEFLTRQISINVLQTISDNHLNERSQEITHVESIISEATLSFKQLAKIREIELAMRPVPQMVKDIRTIAFTEVFKQDIDQLDANSLEVLEKIVGYMEKKYVSMPMKMAKEILINS